MLTLRACTVAARVAAALICFPLPADAAVPDYRLGEVAAEDVITPVPLLVLNAEATDTLKQTFAEEIHLVVRHTPGSAAEAEEQLRATIASARAKFIPALQQALRGGSAGENVETSEPFAATVQALARELPPDLPLLRLARLWVRGQSDEAFVETLLEPLRNMMAQPIVTTTTDGTLSAHRLLRLVVVKSPTEPPSAQVLDGGGEIISAGKVISLSRARRLVETHFPAGEEDVARFVATFVHANAYPDLALTEIVRARRLEGLAVNDRYEAATVIVRKDQIIDQRALNALEALREKNLIINLQSKLEQEQSDVSRLRRQAQGIAAGLGFVCLVLLVVVWRMRSRAGRKLPPLSSADPDEMEARAMPDGGADRSWEQRARIAEAKAERAHEAIRSGVIGWMRERMVQTLASQRADLMSAQQRAEAEMRELEQRLQQLQAPLQERIQAYEKRIEELERELAAKGAENRELMGARINVARQQLTLERERRRLEAS